MSTPYQPKKSGWRYAAAAAVLALPLIIGLNTALAEEVYERDMVIIVDETPGADVTRASQLGGLSVGQEVLLHGNIMEHRGGNNYLFEDTRGTATVIINKADFHKLHARAKDRMEIHGKIVQAGPGTAVEAMKITRLS